MSAETRHDPQGWTIEPTPVHDPLAAAVLYEYADELVSRYFGRPSAPEEIAMAEGDGADLVEPRGVLLLGRDPAGEPVGCVGVRWLDGGEAELTRVFVRRAARRGGAGARLVGAAEDAARARGAGLVRLNTRLDLTEAIALYRRLGYEPTDPYGDDPYAEAWFAKRLH
ncbi:GNAT family N-acetyltransferase [Kitasatospora sp. NPDC096147]|uniref:GNAT family N-acetyltransferase n=1 Tax=Kitasatospora sp. NPDC096147 TaxID=3364093 RepID=UPI00381E56D7